MSDIRPKWKNVARRLQSVSNKNNGFAVLQLSVVIDSNGDPVAWLDPQMSLFEPRSLDLESLKENMGDDEFKEVLDMLVAMK